MDLLLKMKICCQTNSITKKHKKMGPQCQTSYKTLGYCQTWYHFLNFDLQASPQNNSLLVILSLKKSTENFLD